MMSSKTENWLLVEWSGGGREVVYVRSVISPINVELKAGDSLIANRRGKAHPAKLIARARERHELDSKIQEERAAGPSTKNEEDTDESLASGSSWEPSDDGAVSADSDSVSIKRVKLDGYKRKYSNRRSNKTVPMPMNKVTAIIPKSMQQHSNSLSRKRTYKNASTNSTLNYIADSTKKHTIKGNENSDKITIDIEELISIKNSFRVLFQMIDELKRATLPNGDYKEVEKPVDMSVINTTETLIDHTDVENNESEEFNRSDDNVLITNKHKKQRTTQLNKEKTAEGNEWIPIGSGKTLIHIDQFKKVNWRSYTIATRTLLLAAFPRRILATHSLTGKRSPAFLHKPPKMCLDPKIISDVIMEIMDRFEVKENLVRSIITTKCADECKMWKAKLKKKKSKRSENFENIPPEENDNFEHKPISL